jgi:hypothetical protein
MRESLARFNHAACAQSYFSIYETMLERPLVLPEDPAPAKSSPRKRAQPRTGIPRRVTGGGGAPAIAAFSEPGAGEP